MKSMDTKKKKQTKLHIKVGDTVEVIAGKGKASKARGEVLRIDRDKQRAVVKGVNMITKHQKPSASNPNGEIIEKEGSIHLSNLMVVDPKSGKPRRTGRKLDDQGKLQRYFKEHTSLKA